MSKNAEKFIEKISKDPSFRKKISELYKAGKHKEIEQLAAASGFPCSYTEIMKTIRTHGMHLHEKQLSNKELEMLAGGDDPWYYLGTFFCPGAK